MRNSTRLVLSFFVLLHLAGCDDDGNPVTVPTSQARVRFVNALVAASGSALLTANNSAVGGALAGGAAAGTCAAISSGLTTFAFGPPAIGGTGIANSLATVSHPVAAGGDLTVLAAGTVATPQLLVFDNAPAVQPPAGQAALRLTSAVPGSATFDVYALPAGGPLTSPILADLTFGTGSSRFVNVPAGPTELVFTHAGTTAIAFALPALLQLNAGTARTVVLLPAATAAGFQALVLQRC